jgi:S-adenosylmethionine synthetase
MSYIFTSESVSEGHPDKVADQISDAILDAYLEQDPSAKVACEVLITAGLCVIAGEITSLASVDAVSIARQVLHRIGYDDDAVGFNLHKAEFCNALHQQSPEINASVADGGAGDQGLMFGYACSETQELLPLPIALSHRIIDRVQSLRHSGSLPWLRPDAKAQVSVLYEGPCKPIAVETIVISTQHTPDVLQQEIREALLREVVQPILAEYNIRHTGQLLVNPSGSFVIGGPYGDTGLTGRKIIVDTYGGRCPHGGGAFSGKDPSKVDRSAAYAARFIAKHLLEAAQLHECTVQLSYAIGVAEPTSVYVDCGTDNRFTQEQLEQAVRTHFDLTPNGIISTLELKQPIYSRTAAGGHFGKADLPWEVIDPSLIKSIQSTLFN